jgi:hypothetical protein
MKKVLIGCAVASAIIVVLVVGASMYFVSWFKKSAPDTEHLKEVRSELVQKYGERDDYIPPLDGKLDADRVALFVEIREDLVLTRVEIASQLDEFLDMMKDDPERERNLFEKAVHGIQMLKGGAGLVTQGMTYLGARSEKLLEVGMGEGEYFHLYALMAFSWLEWEPLDELDRSVLKDLDMESDIEEMVEEYRRIFERQLRNQRDALQALEARTPDQERALEQVQVGLSADRGRFPYQGQLPTDWIEIFEPFRLRFVDTLPTTAAEMLLDAISLLNDSEDDNFQVNFEH